MSWTPPSINASDHIYQYPAVFNQAMIDIGAFINSKAAASGVASLNSSSKVVQDPANATSTKTASKIPIADGSGYLNTWIQTGTASGTMCAGDDGRLPTSTQKTTLGYSLVSSDRVTLGSGSTGYATSVVIGTGSGGSNPSGGANIYIGDGIATGGTTTAQNVILGHQAAAAMSTSGWNVCIGYQSGNALSTDGGQSCYIGHRTGKSATTGSQNMGIGYLCLYTMTDASNNCAYGALAGRYVTGGYNVFIGTSAGAGGANPAAGDHNTFVGYSAGSAFTTDTNSIALGNGAVSGGSNYCQIGNSSVATYKITAAAWTYNSDRRDKTDIADINLGLDFIRRLRPVNFRFDVRDDYRTPMPVAPDPIDEETATPSEIIQHEAAMSEYNTTLEEWRESNKLENIVPDGTHKRSRYHCGLIAQEVKDVMTDMGVDWAGYQDESIKHGNDRLGLVYEELFGPIVASIQTLANSIDNLTQRVEALEA